MEEEKELEKVYDEGAERFLSSRTTETGSLGLQNREIERPIIFEMIPKNLKGKKLLDIGCGPGIHMKKYIERGAEGFGIDISSKMIALAKEHCPDADFKTGSIYNLEFDDSYFDILTASFVLDHVKDIEKAVKEMKRVLKQNGLCICSIPHPITNMFRGKGNTPSHSYFDKTTLYLNITGTGGKVPDYPHTLQEYIQPFLNNGFVLEEFIENQPNEKWKEKCTEKLDDIYFKIPLLCFFKWKKS